MDCGLNSDKIPEFLLLLSFKSRRNGFLVSFFSTLPPLCPTPILSLWPLSLTVGVDGASGHQLVLRCGRTSAPTCPPDPTLRPNYPKQQKDRREKRGVSKAVPGRGFLKHPVLPLKALFHLLLSPTAHFSEAKADRTQKAWEGGNGDWESCSSCICCILGVQGSELPSVVSSKPTKTTVQVRVSLVEKSN